MEVCNQISFLVLYYNSSRLVTLLKVIDAPMQVPKVFYLTVSSKFYNFSFWICLFFVPKMTSSFTFYIVQIICTALVLILYPFLVSFDLKNLNILHHTMVYAASFNADLDSL